MPALTELARTYNVKPNTIRNWSSEFAPFLSPAANPPKGERRRFTDSDAAVIDLIAGMREDDYPYESIRAHLAAGERGQWPPHGHETAQDGPESTHGRTLVQSPIEATLMRLQAENDVLRRELEYYREHNEELHGRAVAAETKLMLLVPETQEPQAQETTAGDMATQEVTWRERLARWVSGGQSGNQG